MAEPVYRGAAWTPGRNAGYTSGRSSMRTVVCHYTVGRDSTAIGLDGYFHFLVARDGWVQQFAEVDAITWHAGEANGSGPGVEVEYLDEPQIFTPAALDACGALVRWLRDEWGFPPHYHDGARIAPGTFAGFQSHRSVLQSDPHSDYWPVEDFAAMVADTTPDTPTRKGHQSMIVVNTLSDQTGFMTYTPELGHFQPISDECAIELMRSGMPSAGVPWDVCLQWADDAANRARQLERDA